MMSQNVPPRRVIFPIKDWTLFLQESKEEFNIRYGLKGRLNDRYLRSQFEFIRTIGEGAFGRVYLATELRRTKYYAVKTFDKGIAVKRGLTKQIVEEKRILQSLNFTFCVYLEMTFQDNAYVYLGLPFIPGGEIYKQMKLAGKFEENVSKFFGAQILLAIEYLHNCDIIFRDLKPENILLDEYGYVKLTDFGLSKIVTQRTYTLCGTPDYFAPEILMNKGYGKSVDYWSYGVLLYEMAEGRPPFSTGTVLKTYELILTVRYSMPKHFSKNLSDLVYNLLQIDVTKRFGNMKNAIGDIKGHKWFKDIEWDLLVNRKLTSPLRPKVRSPGDTINFDHIKEKKVKLKRRNIYHIDFDEF
ncbi:cAMP-dependent protein kinase catalytic subunit-like [Halyomorpha halys]|nr:cAMP-dependent protein kinase catalytic subunit-like [Halyomorpha halys]